MIPGGAATEEAHGAAVDRLGRIEPGCALHLAAKAELGIVLGAADAGFGLPQARQHFLRVVADR
jgi:hypothetical protein